MRGCAARAAALPGCRAARERARGALSAAARAAQVHCVAQRQFLPKDWIMEQWDAGYYITAIAGAPRPPLQPPARRQPCWAPHLPGQRACPGAAMPRLGFEPARHHMRRSALRPRLREAVRARRAGSNEASSLVVMSKGARFSQQSYKVSEALPYEWIRKKWREARPPPPPARGLRALTGAVPAHECGRPAAPAAPLTACRVSTAAVLLRAARCSHGLPPACALACGARRRMGEKRRRRQGEPPRAPARRAFTSRAWRPRAPAAAAAGAGSGRSS